MPIVWHPLRLWDWCVPEDEKKRDRKTMGISIDLLYLITGYKNATLEWA